MKQRLLAVACLVQIALILFLPNARSDAQAPPTPTQRMYSRDELLTRVAPKPFTIQQLPIQLNSGQGIEDTVAEGGSWFLTFNNLFTATGATGTFVFWIIVFFVVFLLTTWIIKRTGNARSALKSSGLGRGYQSYQHTRTEFRHFRGRK